MGAGDIRDHIHFHIRFLDPSLKRRPIAYDHEKDDECLGDDGFRRATAKRDEWIRLGYQKTEVKESADRGFPMSHKTIAFHANAILQSHLGDGYKPVGESWIFRFLYRHEDELQTHWSKPLDMQRARALNPEVVDAWFDLVKKWIVNQGIRKEEIYGMDESGFPPSGQGTERVVGGRGVKTQHKQGGADRENVTALVTICADGTALRPTIIFKGKNFMKKWGEDNIANAS